MKRLKEYGTKIRAKAKYCYLTGLMVILPWIPAYAADNKYAKNAGGWLLDGIQTLVIVAAAGVIGMFVVKRKFVQMAVALLVSAIIVAIVFQPELLKTIGNYIVNVIFA